MSISENTVAEPAVDGWEKEYQTGTNRRNAVERLTNLIKNNGNKPLIIKSKDGEVARLSKSSIGKLVSKDAVKKSTANGFTAAQHFAVAANIGKLFRDSTKVLTHPDKKGRPDIAAIHRFISPLFKDNAAFITVREETIGHGKRIYSVELIEMGKLEGYWNEGASSIAALGIASDPATSSPIAINNIQISP